MLLEAKQVPSVKKVLMELRRFFSMLSKGQQSSLSTKHLTDAFGWVSREVRVQHDAHELNRILIDAIERSLKGLGEHHEQLVNRIYQGTMVSRTLCLECEYCSERSETFLDAIVQVKGFADLRQSLSKQCESEYLIGDNKYQCDKCNEKRDAKRSVAYTKLPNVLTLALNRFVFNFETMQREKCNERFEFPLLFDFEPYLDEQLAKTQTHRTSHDDERLQAAYKEHAKEQKRKAAAKQKRLDEEERRKKQSQQDKARNKQHNNGHNQNNRVTDDGCNKAPLAITLPPGAAGNNGASLSQSQSQVTQGLVDTKGNEVSSTATILGLFSTFCFVAMRSELISQRRVPEFAQVRV